MKKRVLFLSRYDYQTEVGGASCRVQQLVEALGANTGIDLKYHALPASAISPDFPLWKILSPLVLIQVLAHWVRHLFPWQMKRHLHSFIRLELP